MPFLIVMWIAAILCPPLFILFAAFTLVATVAWGAVKFFNFIFEDE